MQAVPRIAVALLGWWLIGCGSEPRPLAHPRTRTFLLERTTRFVGVAATPRQGQAEGQVPEMNITWIMTKPKPAASEPRKD